VDLIPVVSKGVLRAQRFPGVTVPALKLDDRRVQGSMEIARELDHVQPDPPLFPADPQQRLKVEEAEAWGDSFQQKPRRFVWWALKRNRPPMASYSEGARMGIPVGLAVRTGGPIVAMSARFNGATDENVRSDLASLPADLDRIDTWIKEGVLGGPEPNAADYQIATSLRLAMSLDDLRPFIDGRPCGEFAKRVDPDFPGRMPPILPPEWLEPLRPLSSG
jgi:glutathione S-transferase